MSELVKCPFCNSSEITIDDHFDTPVGRFSIQAACGRCYAIGPSSDESSKASIEMKEQQAADRWNQRAGDVVAMCKHEKRHVTAHAVDGALGDLNLRVTASGEYSPGGAQNCYQIAEQREDGFEWLHSIIVFQNGNPADGVNGVTLEAVLATCFDRLEHFQKGPYANAYNAEALHHIERAIEALKDRTRERDRVEAAK